MQGKVWKTLLLFSLLLLLASQNVFAGGNKENTGLNKNGTASASNVKNAESVNWLTIDENGNVKSVPAEGTENLVPPLDAVGVEYVDKAGKVLLTEYFDTDEVWLGNWLNYIASAVNQVVFRIALAIHPFPNTMFSLYDLNLYISSAGTVDLVMNPNADNFNNFKTDQLLISNQYYTTNRTVESESKMTTDAYVPMAESNSNAANAPLQEQKWSLVTMLFVSCFVAEILFTAIYGYATGSSEEGGASLLKNIAKKCAITLMLFVLVAALPFLLEAFRYGLFKIAYGFYGVVANGYERELAAGGYSREKLINDAGEVTNIFQLPGFFLQSMKSFFVKSSSSLIKNSISTFMAGSTGEGKGQSLITFAITWLVSLIFRFFMFIMILKCAIHIAKNILEVYILLGLVMILTPFAVFTPTKTLGAKCIMSLVSNVVECFIILVIILTVIPAVKVTTVSLLGETSSLTRQGTYKYSIDYIIDDKTEHKLNFIAGDGFVMAICSLGDQGDKIAFRYSPAYKGGNEEITEIKRAEGVKFEVNFSDVKNNSDNELKPENVQISAWDSGLKAQISVKDGVLYKDGGSNGYAVFRTPSMLKMIANSFFFGQFNETTMKPGSSFDEKEALSKAVQYFWDCYGEDFSLREELYGLVLVVDHPAGADVGIQIYRDDPVVSDYVLTATADHSTALMFLQFTIIFMSMFLPCYFVQQSTQITNGLLNGSAGMESLANAMNDVIGKTAHGVQRAAGGLVSGVGNIAKGINTHNSNTSQASQASAAQRTADATSAMLDMMRGSGNNSPS